MAIEEMLERSRRVRGALSEIPSDLQRLETAFMQQAFTGQVTAAWREAHQRGESGASLLQRLGVGQKLPMSDGRPYDLPNNWCWTTLKDVTQFKGGLQKGKKRSETDTLIEVPYLRVANVQRGGLDLSEVLTIPVTQAELDALRLEPGDVLLNEGGDRDKLGRGWVWEGQIENCVHQNHVFRARPVPGLLHPKLISWYANTFGQEFFFRGGKQTTGLASISMGVVSALPVPLMPWPEQLVLVAEIEAFLGRTRQLREYARVEEQLDRLSTSILRKAFAGEL